jgi:anti-sigma-K factor RskA
MSDRTDLHLLAGAYALGALSDDERAEFEEYLETSEEARAELASLTDTAVILGLASTPVQPPASVKDSLMARIAVTPQLAPLDAPAEADADPDVAAPVTSIESARAIRAAGASTAEGRAKRRWYRRPATYLTAVAAAAAIVLGGTAVVALNNSSQTSAVSSDFATISAAPDSQRASEAVDGGGKATLVWSNSLGRSAVVMDGMPTLAEGKTYELWYISGSIAKSAGTFVPSGSGKQVHILTGKMSDGDTVGITVEPSGGSTHPTTKPVVTIATA